MDSNEEQSNNPDINKPKIDRKKFIVFGVLIITFVVGITYLLTRQTGPVSKDQEMPSPSAAVNISPTQKPVPAVSVFTQNLDVPWAIAFLPDRRLLVTERGGKVVIIDANGVLQPTPAVTLPVVTKPDGEGGLLGIALSPNFSQNHYVYLYYTYSSNGNNTTNRVVRMTFTENKLQDEKILVDNIPSALYHNGGRIKFGPDGYLYITTGDSEAPSLAQNTNSLVGKILRITEDGKPAPGNPFNNLVYSYGHRNPEGIAWDSSGQLWETEHGPSGDQYGTGNDEINRIEKGKNYGWPIILGNETKSGMVTSVKNSTPSVTWAPGDAVFVGNSLFFTGLRGQTLYKAVIQDNKVAKFEAYFSGKYRRLREVVLGPDGMLYVTTSNKDGRGTPQSGDDKIIRIDPGKL